MKRPYFLFAVALAGCGGGGSVPSSSKAGAANLADCITNMKFLSVSMAEYANDYDDVFPLGNTWCDSTMPYTRQKSRYTCPAITAPNESGYSINSAFAGAIITTIPNPANASLVFESNSVVWNSSQPLSDQLTHSRHAGVLAVGYADGHVGQVSAP